MEVSRRLDQDEGGAHFHGLVRCGSWSACPVCSAAIAARREQEIEGAIRSHLKSGGEVLLASVTLTPFQLLGKWADEQVQEARKKWEEWRRSCTDRPNSSGLRASEPDSSGPASGHFHSREPEECM